MALHWRPVGPESPETYWQRRGVLLVVVLGLLFVVLRLLSAGGGTDEVGSAPVSPAPSPSPSATVALIGPAASPSPTVAPCEPTALDIEVGVEKESYPVGGRPRLTLSITNTGSAPCTRDLGQAAVELVVTSGEDRIWSSDDCAPGGDIAQRTLLPGKPETIALTWAGKRSLPKCAGDQARAQAGTYRVGGRVGQLEVKGGSFRLTG